jgi:hypothetical protein
VEEWRHGNTNKWLNCGENYMEEWRHGSTNKSEPFLLELEVKNPKKFAFLSILTYFVRVLLSWGPLQKLHNEELHSLYCCLTENHYERDEREIFRVVEIREMHTKFWSECLNKRHLFEDRGLYHTTV